MGSASILHRPLRLPRFSLRGLLLFFPLVALFVASAANELTEYRREQAAWRELEQLGGRRSGFDDARRSWGAWMLGPLLPEMDRITGLRLGFYTPRELSSKELDRAMELLARLPCLRDLSLHGLAVTDRHLEQLARLPALVHVDLQGTQITDAGLATLDRLPALRYATLAETAVSDPALERLADREKARYWLELKVSREADQAMAISPALATPEQLAMERRPALPPATPADALHVYSPLPQALFDRLVRWRQMDRAKQLKLTGVAEMSAELPRFAVLPLEVCDLSGLASLDQPLDLAFAGRWAKLQYLSLPDSPIGATQLQALARCTELNRLSCPSLLFDDEAAAVIVRNHPKLSILELGQCQLTDRGVKTIASLEDLQQLSFRSKHVTNEGLDVLRAHAALLSLELDWSQYPPQTRLDFQGIAAP